MKPYAEWALVAVAFTESSFFPIPPDVLLIALGVLAPARSFRYALVCSAASVTGGMFGYLIGLEFFHLIGESIISLYGVQEEYLAVQHLYAENAFAAIAVAGFTPIPYKVFTIAAGAFQVPFWTMVVASAISRPARFFLVAGLIYWFGPRVKPWIDRYFEALTVAFTILLVLGFVVIKYLV